MKRADQRLLWGPFAVAGVMLIAWYFVWRAGADVMRGAIADFAREQADNGGEVSYQPMRARGFPFFLRGEIDDFAIARGKYRLKADTVYLHAVPWKPDRIVFSAAPGLRLDTPKAPWTLRAEGARASVEKTGAGGNWLFKAEIQALDGAAGATSLQTARAVINVSPDKATPGAYAVSFRVLDAKLRNARGVTAVPRLDAALTATAKPFALTIHGLDSEIDRALVTVSGSVGADRDGYLAGTLDAAIDNPAALAEALRIMDVLKPEETRSVEAGLALFAAAGGGRMTAPLSFSDGETKLAGVKIARAPRLGRLDSQP
ncbi:MAG: DUF2125 domain-containing protein [Parvularculaceae bacterium]|nr:DUF2125 domain-containing protein [Parvularculaceae bacterium]